MFTGIVEESGVVAAIHPSPSGIRLVVDAHICARDTGIGQSIAVNGCCLTRVSDSGKGRSRSESKTKGRSSNRGAGQLHFDLLQETWMRTGFHRLERGARVNLERSMPAAGRFDGHLVTGHIDHAGVVRCWKRVGADWYLEVAAPDSILRYVVHKGSIAVDGISLTVAAVKQRAFGVWIIPHTRAVTNLVDARPGQLVNLEADIVAKYIERLLHFAPNRRMRADG